jgi:hypothetical protein
MSPCVKVFRPFCNKKCCTAESVAKNATVFAATAESVASHISAQLFLLQQSKSVASRISAQLFLLQQSPGYAVGMVGGQQSVGWQQSAGNSSTV